MIEVLEALNQYLPIRFIYSHMETGNGLTFNRDKAVDRWCSLKGITWKQWSARAIQLILPGCFSIMNLGFITRNFKCKPG